MDNNVENDVENITAEIPHGDGIARPSLDVSDMVSKIAKYDRYCKIFQYGRRIAKKKKVSFKKGLDFGTGLGLGMMAARDMGIDFTGLETVFARPVTISNLSNMTEQDYKIVVRDTMKLPWTEFEDDEFDFVIARWSIHQYKKDPSIKLDKKWFERRLFELSRITKDGGIWLVYPGQRLIDVRKFKKKLPKNLIIKGG